MGFSSVYRSLTEIFPQIDARMLRAVAIEHPKDADEAAAVVLSEIVPSLPSDLSHDPTQSWNKSSGSISEREVERGLEDVVSRCRGLLVASGSKSSTSSSSETIPLVIGRGHDTSAPSTKLVPNGNELTNLPPNVGPGVCQKDVEIEEVQSLGKAHGKEHVNYDLFGLHVPKDDLALVVSAVAHENVKSTSDFWQDLGFHMTRNQAESSTSIGSRNAVQKLVDITPGDNMTSIQQGSCFEVGTKSKNDEPSKGSLASENGDTASKRSLASVNGDTESKRSLASVNGDTELGGAFSSSTHGCSVDYLEEVIEDAKTNKKTLLTVMDSVMNLMKEVEIEEKDAEKSELEAARGGLDTLIMVEELKKKLKHDKEANDMHAGEVYGEKSVLATEAKELENRLLNLSEQRDKSLDVLDEMRETLELRLAAALEMKRAAEQEKKVKEDSALKALAEQEAIMEKVVQEAKLLQQEAEENSKLREFLMDRGQVVDSLQGEISVICQDVKLLKEKFDSRVSLTKSISSSQTSSCGSYMRNLMLVTPSELLNGVPEASSNNKRNLTKSISSSQTSSRGASMRSLMLVTPSQLLNGVPEASSNNKIPEEETAASTNKEKDDRRELLEDGWDLFDKEIEL